MMPSISALLEEETLVKLRAGQLDRSELWSKAFRTLPLRQACKGIRVDWVDPVVLRYNGVRQQSAACSPVSGVGTEKARSSIAKQIEAIPLPTGYTMHWEGEKKASNESMRYLFNNFPLAIILMITILIMLFKEFRKVGIIFCCIPLVLVGVIIFMLLSGKTFGFVAICGILGLIGMMIKNGIVLMDEMDAQLAAGGDAVEALKRSSMSRLRPVMMASLTTVLGMIPLLGDSMFGSLAATIMGGLTFGTIVVLIMMPVLYALFYNIKKS